MKTKLRISIIILLIGLLLLKPGYATDLAVTDILPPYLVLDEDFACHPFITIPQHNGGAPIAAVIENMNELTASNYTVYFYVFDQISQDLLWWDHKIGTDLAPNSKDTICSVNWTPYPGYFAFYVTVNFSEDTDSTNNYCFEQMYEAILHPDVVTEKVKQKIQLDFPEMLYDDGSIKSPGYLKQEPLLAGQQVRTVFGGELDIVIENTSYLIYVPYFFSDRYSQPAEIFFIDAKDTTITVNSINWYFDIDSVSFLPNTWAKIDSGYQVFGFLPEVDSITQFDVISEEISTIDNESACALLVSGKIIKGWERTAFAQDLDFIKKNLMLEQYGPQIPEGQIVTIDTASKQEILDALERMKDKCKKIYFYYTGHGIKDTMSTDDDIGNQMSYHELATALDETNAEDICVIIDACYSGSAEKHFRRRFDYTPKKLTLITASMSTKTSYSSTVYTTESGEEYNPGFFTWYLMKCFGDPKADKDGDGKTSMKEAYYYLLQINPSNYGESISNTQNPQLMENQVVQPEPEQTNITVPDMGIGIDLDQPLDENAAIYIKETSGIENTGFSGDNIIYISDSRYYSIDLVDQYSPFNMDITFTYDSKIDSVRTGEVDMGLVKRDSSGVAWEKIPSVHLPDINKVKATDITGFSDFAFAHVIPEDISEIINSFTNRSDFEVYPNPANHSVILKYNMEKPGNAEFRIMDISGRILRNEYTTGNAGNNIYFMDLSLNTGLKPGVYYIILYTEDHIFSEIIMIE